MGDHELEDAVRPWWARVWGQIRYRAKAFVSGLVVLLAGEAILLLADAQFQETLKGLVPEPYQPFIPLAIALVVGIITHAVPNASSPTPSAPAEDSE